jgi:hypothetical protein
LVEEIAQAPGLDGSDEQNEVLAKQATRRLRRATNNRK